MLVLILAQYSVLHTTCALEFLYYVYTLNIPQLDHLYCIYMTVQCIHNQTSKALIRRYIFTRKDSSECIPRIQSQTQTGMLYRNWMRSEYNTIQYYTHNNLLWCGYSICGSGMTKVFLSFPQLFASGGGGCCDCGDPEAWTSCVHCELHKPTEQNEEEVPRLFIATIV